MDVTVMAHHMVGNTLDMMGVTLAIATLSMLNRTIHFVFHMSQPFAPVHMTPPPFQNDVEQWRATGRHLTATTLSIVDRFHYIVTLGKIGGDLT